MKNRNYLKEEFEREMWLYAEGSLDKDRMNFWDDKLNADGELKKLYETNLNLIETTPETPAKISSSEFKSVLEKVSKPSFLKNAQLYLKDILFNNDRHLPKLAFGVSLIIAAIMFSVISEKPNPIKEMPDDILSWNPTGLTQKINNVENYFYSIALEEQKVEEIQKTANKEWQNNYYRVESDLELVKDEIKENEL